jgi:hypothetical protein
MKWSSGTEDHVRDTVAVDVCRIAGVVVTSADFLSGGPPVGVERVAGPEAPF